MTDALDALNAARRAWERSQPQTFMDFAALEEGLGCSPVGARPSSNADTGVTKFAAATVLRRSPARPLSPRKAQEPLVVVPDEGEGDAAATPFHSETEAA